MEEALALKAQGNQAFLEKRFDQAVLYYTLAIETCSSAAEHLHILYSNRSASNCGLGKFAGRAYCYRDVPCFFFRTPAHPSHSVNLRLRRSRCALLLLLIPSSPSFLPSFLPFISFLSFLPSFFPSEAIQDANEAIRLDPQYLKGYHRKATAGLFPPFDETQGIDPS
jgi:hypothetical protein